MFTKLLISYYRGEKIKLGITDRIVIKKEIMFHVKLYISVKM